MNDSTDDSSSSRWQSVDGSTVLNPWERLPGIDRADESDAMLAVKRDGLVLYLHGDGPAYGPFDPAMEHHNREVFGAWKAQRDAKRAGRPRRDMDGDTAHQRALGLLDWWCFTGNPRRGPALANTPQGDRDELTKAALRALAPLVNDGTLSHSEFRDAIMEASEHNGHLGGNKTAAQIERDIDRALTKFTEPFDWAHLDDTTWEAITSGRGINAEAPSRKRTRTTQSDTQFADDYSITMRRASDILDAAPEWAWFYDGKGRLMRGTPILFAGRPGAGKSTAARYFAAAFTRGEVEGCFLGTPVTVAYIAAEESVKYMVKPSLRAHNADMRRIVFPEVTLGGTVVKLLSVRDEQLLTEQLLAENVSVVVVDPIMSTITGRTDVHRTNETREQLEPWTRIAEKVNGLVIGIVHLRKQFGGDIIAAINASSAFGEIARGVLAFAQDLTDGDDGERVMSQEKNSAGAKDLAMTYSIETTEVRTDDGEIARPGRFVLGAPSARRVADVLGAADTQERLGPVSLEVLEVVREHGEPVGPSTVASQVEGLDNDTAGKYLRRLAKAGLLVKAARGLFDLPNNVKPRQ